MIETRPRRRSEMNHNYIVLNMLMRITLRLTAVRYFLITCVTVILLPSPVAAFDELPLVVYGKVVNVGEGGTYQLFRGTLRFEVINTDDPGHVINFEHELRMVGKSGEFSYRKKIPQQTAPAVDELSSNLIVGSKSIRYVLKSASLDGHPASLLDPGQASELVANFANRGEELRFDFKVDITLPDSDGDGMPDWWEEQNGLDAASAADASLDPDLDGWDNLLEFAQATDPNEANGSPIVQESKLVVMAGGRAGIHFSIVDADTSPEDLRLNFEESTAGLDWYSGDAPLDSGQPFTYSDILAGRISIEVSSDFRNASVGLTITDLSDPVLEPVNVNLQIEGFSPADGWLGKPAVWLDAERAGVSGPVSEWSDLALYRRDGYQPYADSQPENDRGGRIQFSGKDYLFLDDGDLSMERFTLFMVYENGAENRYDQTLFSSPDLQLSLGGRDSGAHSRSIRVIQNGRRVYGPVVRSGVEGERPDTPSQQLLLTSGAERTSLRVQGQGLFVSHQTTDSPLSTFMSLGAERALSSDHANKFFQGNMREFILYDRVLTPENRGALEDYQLARWQDLRIWNYRHNTLPVIVTGSDDVRNSIAGGAADDELTGGHHADILRGGGGDNLLMGRGGSDRFVFSKTASDNVILDFSPEEGDVIDLTEIFMGQSGNPSDFVRIDTVVERDENNIPSVNTVLELNYEGSGETIDQTISVKGTAFGGSDLATLMGEGNLVLGGPQFETEIFLAEAPATIDADGNHLRRFYVNRSGNADAAISVPLSFAGSGLLDYDYHPSGILGDGDVKTISMGRGQTQVAVDLLLDHAILGSSLDVALTTLLIPEVSDPSAQLSIPLGGENTLVIQTIRHIRAGEVSAGSARITLRGDVGSSLEVGLDYAGSLVNGVDYDEQPATLRFAPGQSVAYLEFNLKRDISASEAPRDIDISISMAPSSFSVREPGVAHVVYLGSGENGTEASFADWSRERFPGQEPSSIRELDPDGDGLSNLSEYLAGSDPAVRDPRQEDRLSLVGGPDLFELKWRSAQPLTDVGFFLQQSSNLVDWQHVQVPQGDRSYWLQDEGYVRVFTHSVGEKGKFFRIKPVIFPDP